MEVAGPGLGAVRLDSGDLGVLAHQVRDQLDALGARDTRIVVTSDLDEHAIAALAAAPVDAYGVGTQLVTGSGHPTCGFVYKLVRARGPRRRAGVGREAEHGQDLGRGPQVRPAAPGPYGRAEAEVVGIGVPPVDDGDDRPSWSRWWARASWWGASRWRRHARGTWRHGRSCPWPFR